MENRRTDGSQFTERPAKRAPIIKPMIGKTYEGECLKWGGKEDLAKVCYAEFWSGIKSGCWAPYMQKSSKLLREKDKVDVKFEKKVQVLHKDVGYTGPDRDYSDSTIKFTPDPKTTNFSLSPQQNRIHLTSYTPTYIITMNSADIQAKNR